MAYKNPSLFKRIIPALLFSFVVLLFSPQRVDAGFWEGFAAYKRGDYATALNEWRPLAKKGHADAQHNLGLMYEEGLGVPQDYKKAVEWYRKAAKQRHGLSQFRLGLKYEEGLGVPQDYMKAVEWCRKAAEQGLAGAQAFLGLMYIEGKGVPQNYVLAHKWLILGSSSGNKEVLKSRDQLEKLMTPSELEEAQRLAKEWKPKRSK